MSEEKKPQATNQAETTAKSSAKAPSTQKSAGKAAPSKSATSTASKSSVQPSTTVKKSTQSNTTKKKTPTASAQKNNEMLDAVVESVEKTWKKVTESEPVTKTVSALKNAVNSAKKTVTEKTSAAGKKTSAKKAPAKKPNAKKTVKKKNAKSLNFQYLSGLLFSKMARGGAMELRSNADTVNKLNVFPVPDGDTGDNMRMTIESGIAAIENLDTDDLAEVMNVLSHGMLLGARGNSGVILSQFFAGTAKGLEGCRKADPTALGHALEMGVKQAYASVMTPTEGTILTVARESVEYAVAHVTEKSTIRTFFADLVKEMHASLERTPEILEVLKEAEVVDSGGAGLLYIMSGFNRVLNGEELETPEATPASSSDATKAAAINLDTFGPDSEMTYGYCTELLVRLQNKKVNVETFDVEALKAFLADLGDSIVAFQTDSIVKIHVHTKTPERVLAHCRTFGEFLTVKIENMSLQHTSSTEAESGQNVPEARPVAVQTSSQRKKYGVVAVCIGDGIEKLYREIGTDEIVEGGQTQNPSTNDFLDAFAKVPAEHIFVFPNNGNILLAAQQAAELYTAATIHVIPSKNIGTGYAALSTADFEEADPQKIADAMTEAMKHVTSGYISPSIRDAEINGVHIEKGDTIGIVEKAIVVSEKDRITAAMALVSKLMEGDRFMLTVFVGKDSTPAEQQLLQNKLTEQFSDAEIYFTDGGQEIYPYIFVAE